MRTLKINDLPDENVEPKWLDKDVMIIFACFQLLEDYVNEENPFEQSPAWANGPNGTICKQLYDWWQVRKVNFFNGDDGDDDMMLVKLMTIRRTLWT